MSEKHPIKVIALNAAYTFVILAIAFLSVIVAKLIFNLFLPLDLVSDRGGDYSRNYLFAFPIHGLITSCVFAAVCYFGSKKIGFNYAFRFRQNISNVTFVIQVILGYIAFYFLFLYMLEWWQNLPTWFLSGFLAAVTGIIDAHNIYNNAFGGFSEDINIYLQYFWLHILLELLFAVGCSFVMKYGRKHGEANAEVEHAKQLAELEHEKERIASKKTLG